jgi:hypothetical protein
LHLMRHRCLRPLIRAPSCATRCCRRRGCRTRPRWSCRSPCPPARHR